LTAMESSVPSVRNIGETKPDRPQGSAHRRSADPAMRTRLRGLPLIAVLALATLLTLKIEFRSPDANFAFYAYGIMVTTVILVTMTISFAFYRDPAVVARVKRPELNTTTALRSGPLVTCIVAVHNEEALVRQCIAS